MLDLGLFRIRNFAVANLTTLAAYAGLIGGLFFVGLFLQQIVGYSPLEAGLATTPISVILFFLSPRFGKLASGVGPRLPMTAGPIVGGLGLLLLLRVGANAELRHRSAAGDPRLRPRPLGDGGAADRDRARLGRRNATSGSHRASTTASPGSRACWRSPSSGRSSPPTSAPRWTPNSARARSARRRRRRSPKPRNSRWDGRRPATSPSPRRPGSAAPPTAPRPPPSTSGSASPAS